MNKTAAVLWTGGKDCALAFLKAQRAGYDITYLITFTPQNPDFKAHPITFIKKQITAIGLQHEFITVVAPLKESYEEAIQSLKDNKGIHTLITGDIDEIDGHSNWIEECCKKSKMHIFNPLWKKDRNQLLQELICNNFTLIFSLVKKEFFEKKWVGKQLNSATIRDLQKLNIDICGENGEYHTMVLNAPFFQYKVIIDTAQTEENEHFYYIKTS